MLFNIDLVRGINSKPEICYGISEPISKSKGYSMLNEQERLFCERYGLLPLSLLEIKQRIIERKALDGIIDNPGVQGPYERFWESIKRYGIMWFNFSSLIRIHTDSIQTFQGFGPTNLIIEVCKMVDTYL